jgi:adenylate cyclase
MKPSETLSPGPDTISRRGAILVVDSAGFTRCMLERGAAAALADIWLTRRELIPIFRTHDGEVYKIDADNLYVFFDSVAGAMRACAEAHEAMRRASDGMGRTIAISMGIGFGELFYVASEDDYYGPEVNLASKLGEDVAAARETLLTVAAWEQLRSEQVKIRGRVRQTKLSGLVIRYYPAPDSEKKRAISDVG